MGRIRGVGGRGIGLLRMLPSIYFLLPLGKGGWGVVANGDIGRPFIRIDWVASI